MSDTTKLIAVGAAALIVGAFAGNMLPLEKTSKAINEDAVREIVADYIADNPTKIVEALQSMQRQAYDEERSKGAEALKENMAAITDTTTSPTIGTGESGVKIVEFFDYRCGYCKKMSPVIQKLMEEHPDILVIFKELPILSEGSQLAARAALAISKLSSERYFEYHNMLMNHQGDFDQAALNDYAGQVKVDAKALEDEMNAEWVMKEIQTVSDLAGQIGVRGTPAFIVGEELIPGAVDYAELEARIAALKE